MYWYSEVLLQDLCYTWPSSENQLWEQSAFFKIVYQDL